MTVKNSPIEYDKPIETALGGISGLLQGGYGISKRAVALLLLQGDAEIEQRVKEQEDRNFTAIQNFIVKTRSLYSHPLSYIIAITRQRLVKNIHDSAVTTRGKTNRGFADWLSRVMMNPVSGVIVLFLVLYFGLYQFVGVFGAGTLVDFIENVIFGEWINPWVSGMADSVIPFQWLRDLFVGEYGLVTLGLSYAIAIILPIVGTFFIVFSVIEDSGYLPRLAMLIDRVFKSIGLNGRAVIPVVLGFGCDTMATIVTRTQETKRERIITTLLLALAIPCSAQLGVILAILSGNSWALFTWATVVIMIFLLVGFLASKVIPGKGPSFYMEVPPLRLPKLSNVLTKTYTRLQWYFIEVLPFFLYASALLWLGDLIGVLNVVTGWLEPIVEFIGLPSETSIAFLYGFFRRDFGAAGLYDLNNSGDLVGVPLVVAAITMTLFIPCIAQFGVMLKERGIKTALAITIFVFPFAFLVGYLVNLILTSLRVTL
ncbi:nucleoside recognition domain-containing protein [Chloroflexota bacterium]